MPNERTVPGVCHKFNSSKSECMEDGCEELHICYHFAIGDCRYGDKCKRTHLLTTIHNKAVLKANGWQHDNQHPKVLKLLEEKFKPKQQQPEEGKDGGLKTPKVCFTYNNALGCGSDECNLLHLCLNFLTNKCTQGKKCNLDHDLAVSQHNIRVLRSARLVDTEQQLIIDVLKKKYIAMSNVQDLKKKKAEAKQEEKCDEKMKAASRKQGDEKDKPKSQNTPVACIAYNKDGCNKQSCQFLHVCFGYIMGTCDKKGKCLKEHNVFQGEQNKEVLRRFDMLAAKDIYTKIRAGYEARAAAKAAAIESPAGAEGGATGPPPQRRSAAPPSLTCSVCMEPFIRATTLGCTHTFCEECVRRAERGGQPCPLCRAPVATAVRSLAIDDMVDDWFADRDQETQRARLQLVTERRRAAAVPAPLAAAAQTTEQKPDTAAKKNKPPACGQQRQQRSKSKGRGAKTVVTTTVTYH